MIWIIKNKKELKGTAYIEIYPEKYVNTHWNDSSIFFEEYHFEYFVPIIRRHYPNYDPYGFQSINIEIWKKIIIDFKELGSMIKAGAKTKEIRQEISFLSDYSENEHYKNEKESLNSLEETINFFIIWLEQSFSQTNIISILGL